MQASRQLVHGGMMHGGRKHWFILGCPMRRIRIDRCLPLWIRGGYAEYMTNSNWKINCWFKKDAPVFFPGVGILKERQCSEGKHFFKYSAISGQEERCTLCCLWSPLMNWRSHCTRLFLSAAGFFEIEKGGWKSISGRSSLQLYIPQQEEKKEK